MRAFLSSTFLDLVEERDAVLKALHKSGTTPSAMEYFLATPSTPRETALEKLRDSDVMILVIGFKAGTLLPDGSGSTYTSAEYDEFLMLKRETLVFVKQKKRWWERRPSWRNDERDSKKRAALSTFKVRACEHYNPAYFMTPDQLALAVIQALGDWEGRGRPGARKTFASPSEYFLNKNPAGQIRILDFDTTLLGREQQISALDNFAKDDKLRVCILSGRGGIGKSKILHDWAKTTRAVFLKDEPFWHKDSEKEIPIECNAVIVDDAHRQEAFGRLLQLIQDTATHRNLKLVISTRPGSATRILQEVLRKFDYNQVQQLPELQELTRQQSKELAGQVLGKEFANFSEHLAEIGSNSPLVIVAGGRLIATRRIHPSTLTTLEEFRSTIFNRLLDGMDLRGAKFPIDPPQPVLDLIAALGPINVESREFQESAEVFLSRPRDEILATVDALASASIITPRPKPVRVLPDVLSDYLVEQRCIGAGTSTRYADRVYEFFGAHSLRSLMRNLAELDWRRGQSGETGLNLLDGIWADIYQRFTSGDEYLRHRMITDLASAAIYQPDRIIALVRTAVDQPILQDGEHEGSEYRAGQDYVLSALPTLLEATAHHPDRFRESVMILWELARGDLGKGSTCANAEAVLKRLASWNRFGNPAFSFAMLVQAICLTRRTDAFTRDFTPFTLIRHILEREGEFEEWQDETTISFGAFGLNYAAVGLVRESALEYLDFALASDGSPALHAISIMEDLLCFHLNRVGRRSTDEEIQWQTRERERCLQVLLHRYQQQGTPLLKAKLYNAFRSATSMNHPENIQQAAARALQDIEVEDATVVLDGICTDAHHLPFSSADFSSERFEKAITELMMKARSGLERITADTAGMARYIVDQVESCIDLRVKTEGFHRFMLTFVDRPDFLGEMAESLISNQKLGDMLPHLSSVLNSIHMADPAAFRERALSALHSKALHVIHACAHNLRVFERATGDDVAVIEAYARYPDSVAKRGAAFAIAYMGKFTELREDLKQAAMAIHPEGDRIVAVAVADAFGPYGVPLTDLTRGEAAALATKFLLVEDWDFDQEAIPRFLNRFVTFFPDETYELLLKRIEQNTNPTNNDRRFIRFRPFRQNISFDGIPGNKRLQLGQDCLHRLMNSESAEDVSDLFWIVAGFDETALHSILAIARNLDDRGIRNLTTLISKAVPNLAFTKHAFARDLIGQFSGKQREEIVDALAYQARHLSSGVFVGDPGTYMDEREKRFKEQAASFPDEAGLEDLARALRRFT